MMRCPKCNSDEIELRIHQEVEEEWTEAEIYCLHCEDIVAFYRIEDKDWVAED